MMYSRNLFFKLFLSIILLLFFFLSESYALDVTLQWDANSKSHLAGYYVYYDTDSGAPYEGIGAQEGKSPVDMPLDRDENPDPDIVEFTFHNLPDGDYYFSVTAYNNEVPALESGYSNEVTTVSTLDDTSPLISNLHVSTITEMTAIIAWTTDEPGDSNVNYGTSSGEWESYTFSQSSDSFVTSHSITITGLLTNTTYYFRVGSSDASDNGPAISSELSFTTASAPDTTPPFISNIQLASNTDTTARIQWTTDEPGDSNVNYGTSSGEWESYTFSKSSGSFVTSHSVTITGLVSNTTYYFRVGSSDVSDNGPAISSELSFTTDTAPDTTPPFISNIQLASNTDTTATIQWTTDEASDSTVRYGTESGLWEGYLFSKSSGSRVTNHSINLTGLNPNSTYYFRVGSTDSYDNTRISSEMSFITDPAPDIVSPYMLNFPVIDYVNDTIDVTFSKSNMQNVTTESNYSFSPSLLFKSLGGSDDITTIGNNTYRLGMSSIPNHLIFTLKVNGILDEAGNLVSPSSIKINDNDNDGMADDWESFFGVSSPLGDADGDSLNNLQEYENNTNPNDQDTDNDDLPDAWEVTYGLDPNDNTGVNGGNGDPDNDGWTNYDEYSSGSLPNSDSSPIAKTPKIKKTIPRNNSGCKNKKRIPTNTSFAVRIQDSEGIDVTDKSSIKFTIDDGMNPVYERDLGDTSVVRVVKLRPDTDTQATNFWAVYDRSLDNYGNFPFDADVNIKVDVRNRRGGIMSRAGYDFNVETINEHHMAQDKRPETTVSRNAGLKTIMVINNSDLAGFKVIYDNNESITPLVEPFDEIPTLDLPDVTPVERPVEMGPPNVFSHPVKLIIPITGEADVKDLSVYLYDGDEWVYAVSSYNTGGVIQPDGEDWVVPGSLAYDDTTAIPTLEVQVYHFSGIQAGLFSGLPLVGIDDQEPPSGCFIDTLSPGSPIGSLFSVKRSRGYAVLFIVLALVIASGGMRCCWRSTGTFGAD